MRRPRNAAVVLAVVLASVSSPVAGEKLEGLFPWRAEISPPGRGLMRLELPQEVVVACRPDLSDLRIVDARGQQVPYAVVGEAPWEPVDRGGERQVTQSVAVAIEAVDRNRVDRQDGPSIYREVYDLSLAEEVENPDQEWRLILGTSRAELVRSVEVVDSSSEGEEALGRGALFRLGRQERLELILARPAERFRVVIEGEDGGFIEPTFVLEGRRSLPRTAGTEVVLTQLARSEEENRTVLELERPPGLVPERIELSTSTEFWSRQVEVWDAGTGPNRRPVDRLLASGRLMDLPAGSGRVRPVLSMPLARRERLLGDRLRLVIDDGDAPPLANLEVVARVRFPTLVFSMNGTAGTLLFGGGRALKPRYGMADLVADTVTPPNVGADWYSDPSQLPAARLGTAQVNEALDATPALAFTNRAGAVLDRGLFRHIRSLRVPATGEGLAAVRLGAEDLAAARADLGDLRVIDASDRQWAYLLDPRPEQESVDLELAVSAPVTKNRLSTYTLRSAVERFAPRRLHLEIEGGFFDRAFMLRGQGEEEELVEIARGRLRNRGSDAEAGARLAVELRALPTARYSELVLEVSDGEDAPLKLVGAQAELPAVDLLMAVPEGDYALLLGNAEMQAPRYDLSSARDLVLGVPPIEAVAGPLEPNPERSRWKTAGSDGGGLGKILVWTVLLLAVLVLTVLTLRLSRSGGASDPPGPDSE